MRVGFFHKSIDFTKYGEQPTMDADEILVTSLLDVNRLNRIHIPVRRNDIETEEDFIQLGQVDEYTFYDFDQIASTTIGRSKQKPALDLVFSANVLIERKAMMHIRQCYSLLDMLGDLGGATEVILIIFGVIFYPINEFSFWVKAIQKFFYVKSSKKVFSKKGK